MDGMLLVMSVGILLVLNNIHESFMQLHHHSSK